MGKYNPVTRDSDGTTLRLDKQEAEQADITARAKRVVLVDPSGQSIIPTDMEGKGKITVGTTPIELTFSGTIREVTISSDINNTGIIYIGKSDVLSDGSNAITQLDISQDFAFTYNDTTNSVYIVSDTASQTVIAGATK